MAKALSGLKVWFAKQIEPLSFKQRFVLAVLSLFLPLFLYTYWFLIPAYHKIETLSKDISRLKKEILEYQSLAKQKPILEAKLVKRRIFFKKLVYTLPNEKEIPELLSKVSEQAKQSGLEVISFTPRSEIVQNYYNIIPFNIELTGDFGELVLFLEKVEHLPRIITLNSMDVQMRENRSQKFYLSTKCVFYTYRYTGKAVSQRTKKK